MIGTTPETNHLIAIDNTLSQFINPQQLETLRDNLNADNCEEWEYFRDMLVSLAERIIAMPKTYEQDGKGEDAIVYLHYFIGSSDWWIYEKDKEAEQHQAFGLVRLNSYDPELGYISIVELLENNVELDLHWTPKTIGQIRKEIE